MISSNVTVVGAGPAGTILSFLLSKEKIDHILIEKKHENAGKICGDGLTVDVMYSLKKIKHPLFEEIIHQNKSYFPCYGVEFITSQKRKYKLEFNRNDLPYAPVYTCTRDIFNTQLRKFTLSPYAQVYYNTKLLSVHRNHKRLVIKLMNNHFQKEIHTDLIIGCDGPNSTVRKFLHPMPQRIDSFEYHAIRTYFDHVNTNLKPEFLQFYFLKNLLPGYFWIFPLNNNAVNTGIIALKSSLRKKKLSLKSEFEKISNENKEICQLLGNCNQMSPLEGGRLITNDSKIGLTGNNYILTGDAGGLIEPFLGKGIGIAIYSAIVATDVVKKAILLNNYNHDILVKYEHELYRRFNKQWYISHILKKAFSNPHSLHLFINLLNLTWVHQATENKLNKWLLHKWT